MSKETIKPNKFQRQLPNIFLYFRLIAIPAFIVCMYGVGKPSWMIAALVIFVLASISDFFDGFFARRYNLSNDFGKLMDPLADKVLTSAAFVCLVALGIIAPWGVVVILAREFLVSGIRSLAASEGRVIAARFSGKLKTTIQMFSIIFFLFFLLALSVAQLHDADTNNLLLSVTSATATITYYFAVALTVYSGAEIIFDYIKSKKK